MRGANRPALDVEVRRRIDVRYAPSTVCCASSGRGESPDGYDAWCR